MDLEDNVRNLTLKWRERCEIPGVIRVQRESSVRDCVFNRQVTSCAQWNVTIRRLEHPQLERTLYEFLQVFELAFAAGPRVLNDVVWGEPCPLSWCTCCDDMNYQLNLEINGRTENRELDVAAVFDRVLYHWDKRKLSHEYRELRTALLRYPQRPHCRPVHVILGLYRERKLYKEDGIKKRTEQSLQHLMDHSSCNGRYEVTLRWHWYGGIDECSRSIMHRHFKDMDSTCPIHRLNHLNIVLINGDVSTYVSTQQEIFTMECGGHPQVVIYSKPPQNEEEEKEQMMVICNLNTTIEYNCTGRVDMVRNRLVMFLWNTNPLRESLHRVSLEWDLSQLISNDHLKQLLIVIGGNLQELTVSSSQGDVFTFSQLVTIVNQCSQLNKISIRGLVMETEDTGHVTHVQQPCPLHTLEIYIKPAIDDPIPNLMVQRVLELVGQSLKTLKIANDKYYNCHMDAVTADIITKRCPNLCALHVSYVNDTFCDALLWGFDQGYLYQVRALTLEIDNEHADHSLLEGLQDSTRAITRCLRDFSVAHFKRSSYTEDIMGKMLELNDRLVNVHLWRSKYETHRGEIVREAMRKMSLRRVCALLSGLQVVLGFVIPIEIVRQLLVFTGRPSYRLGARIYRWA